ncbi:kinase-like domain-containing protein [Schizophyllum commune]
MLLRLEDVIGTGGYSRVYAARVASPHPMASGTVAVKRCWTDRKVKNPMLLHEACATLLVRGHPAIPHIYAYGRSQCLEYIALERLGPSIDSCLREGGMLDMRGGLTMRNLIALTCQMVNSLLFPCVLTPDESQLDAINHVHSFGLVHCDIKPKNFLFDVNEASGLIKLIDFGLAKRYCHPTSRVHVAKSVTIHRYGTIRYNSISMHMHHNPSRRDDMESQAYTIAELLCKDLPWYTLDDEDDDVFAVKQTWSGPEICLKKNRITKVGGHDSCLSPLKSLAPEIQGAPLYLPSDRGRRVGKRRARLESKDVDRDRLLKSPTSRASPSPPSLQIGETQLIPGTSWVHTSMIPDDELYGDEQKIVRESLERIEAPPSDDIDGERILCGC